MATRRVGDQLTEEGHDKGLVSRTIEDIINSGRFDLGDEPSAPDVAAAVKSRINLSASFPEVRMEAIDLSAEASGWHGAGVTFEPWP